MPTLSQSHSPPPWQVDSVDELREAVLDPVGFIKKLTEESVGPLAKQVRDA